ncbi:MAG: rod shape-determining protein RodA [Planctomycetota bacterium]
MNHHPRWSGARLPSVSMLLFFLMLLGVGVLFIHSASTAGEVPFPGALARQQLIRIAIGFVFLLLCLRVDYRRLEAFATPLYVFGLVLLIVLIGLKPFRSEASRWFYLPGFALQPSELLKIFTALLLAKVLKPTHEQAPRPWLRPLLIVLVPTGLIALQPDLGTALVLPPLFFTMSYVAGVSRRRLALIALVGLALMPAGWFVLHPYQKDRILVFLDPSHPSLARDDGYQIRQSLTAIGSGGVFGCGLYQGTQNRLNYLPEDHNDFIFAIIGEEWGLVGTGAVLGLFLLLYLSALGIAFRTREPFGRLLVIGMTTHLAFQTLVNVAMTMGLAPVTGLPLPFVSYGGSSLLTSIASLGVVLGVGMRPVRIVAPDGLRSGRALVLSGSATGGVR